jgi:hypothetical protein
MTDPLHKHSCGMRLGLTDPQSNHITVLHAACWVIVVGCGLWVERETRNALTAGYISLYRKVRLFGQLPVIITTLCKCPTACGCVRFGGCAWSLRFVPRVTLLCLADCSDVGSYAVNFGLLVLLGLDTWIEAETGDDPISLVVLQVVACVEALVILAAGLRFMCESALWSCHYAWVPGATAPRRCASGRRCAPTSRAPALAHAPTPTRRDHPKAQPWQSATGHRPHRPWQAPSAL